jgi:hypothetical protein
MGEDIEGGGKTPHVNNLCRLPVQLGVVSLLSLYSDNRTPVTVEQEAVWSSEAVRTRSQQKNYAPAGERIWKVQPVTSD